jgi:DNA-binding MarR family transcriptional regulator
MPISDLHERRTALVLDSLDTDRAMTVLEIARATDIREHIVRPILNQIESLGLAERRLSTAGKFNRFDPPSWRRLKRPTGPTRRLLDACEAVLKRIDATGTAGFRELVVTSASSPDITETAVTRLLVTGTIVRTTGGFSRPGGLDKTSVHGHVVKAIRDLGRPVGRSEVLRMFPGLRSSHVDAVLNRAAHSGQLIHSAGMFAPVDVPKSLTHASDQEILAQFPEEGSITVRELRKRLTGHNTRSLNDAVRRMTAEMRVVRTGRGSYSLPDAPGKTDMSATARVRKIFITNPERVFSPSMVADEADCGVQPARMMLSELYRSEFLDRVGRARYRLRADSSSAVAQLSGPDLESAIKRKMATRRGFWSRDAICKALDASRMAVSIALGELVIRGEVRGNRSRFTLTEFGSLKEGAPVEAAERIRQALVSTDGVGQVNILFRESGFTPRAFQDGLSLLIGERRLGIVDRWAILTDPVADLTAESIPITLRTLGVLLAYGSFANAPKVYRNKAHTAALERLCRLGFAVRRGSDHVLSDHDTLRVLRHPKGGITRLERQILNYLRSKKPQRKTDIASGLGTGRGVINRAVGSLVSKRLLEGEDDRFRLPRRIASEAQLPGKRPAKRLPAYAWSAI